MQIWTVTIIDTELDKTRTLTFSTAELAAYFARKFRETFADYGKLDNTVFVETDASTLTTPANLSTSDAEILLEDYLELLYTGQ